MYGNQPCQNAIAVDTKETYLYSVSFQQGATNTILTSLDISNNSTATLRYSRSIDIRWVGGEYCSVVLDSTDGILFMLGMDYLNGDITNEIWTFK